eukprot:276821-Rhodomonas_salina.1
MAVEVWCDGGCVRWCSGYEQGDGSEGRSRWYWPCGYVPGTHAHCFLSEVVLIVAIWGAGDEQDSRAREAGCAGVRDQ